MDWVHSGSVLDLVCKHISTHGRRGFKEGMGHNVEFYLYRLPVYNVEGILFIRPEGLAYSSSSTVLVFDYDFLRYYLFGLLNYLKI